MSPRTTKRLLSFDSWPTSALSVSTHLVGKTWSSGCSAKNLFTCSGLTTSTAWNCFQLFHSFFLVWVSFSRVCVSALSKLISRPAPSWRFFFWIFSPTCSEIANLLPQHIVPLQYLDQQGRSGLRGQVTLICLGAAGLEVVASHPTDQ